MATFLGNLLLLFFLFLLFDYENKKERKKEKKGMNSRFSQTLARLACKEKTVTQARDIVVATAKIFVESSKFRFKALASSPTFQDSPICSYSCVRVWSLLSHLL
jgi:hypothetical protein